jgi:pyruvate/2-oxoglutarate/acetoin dehydrogenase E1 component
MKKNKLISYSEAIYSATDKILASEKGLLIGQGVDDFKGLWGTTLNLNKKYPTKVIDTPLSEESIAGVCLGASLNGLYPINTHIRADFSLLMFNQLINIGAKYKYMFGGLFCMPSIFRLVVGRSWGQGGQHSQSFQSMLGHIPGLRVFMPATAEDVLNCYMYAFNELLCPVVILEHRLLYDLKFDCPQWDVNNVECYTRPETRVVREGSDITIVATSIMVIESLRAADYLKEYGVSVEVINYLDITLPSMECIYRSVEKTGLLIVADTSWDNYGVGAEVIARIVECSPNAFIAPPKRLGMQFSPCPTSKKLEDLFYSGFYEIVNSTEELVKSRNKNLKIPAVNRESTTKFYKDFKGPF